MREQSGQMRSSTHTGNRRPDIAKSDEELIAEFQDGAGQAFTQLVGRYKDQLMNYAARYLGDRDDADDVVQETFIRIYRNPHAYRPVGKFSTWLYTITTNLARTRLRRRRRYLPFGFGKDRDHPPELPAAGLSADRVADSNLLHRRIEEALAAIPAEYREMVILCDIQELSYEEAGEIAGVNIGTVKSRLHRGRTRLQELLRDVAPDYLRST